VSSDIWIPYRQAAKNAEEEEEKTEEPLQLHSTLSSVDDQQSAEAKDKLYKKKSSEPAYCIHSIKENRRNKFVIVPNRFGLGKGIRILHRHFAVLVYITPDSNPSEYVYIRLKIPSEDPQRPR
jgi:hypothetical protein